jgi:hypothetical protein
MRRCDLAVGAPPVVVRLESLGSIGDGLDAGFVPGADRVEAPQHSYLFLQAEPKVTLLPCVGVDARGGPRRADGGGARRSQSAGDRRRPRAARFGVAGTCRVGRAGRHTAYGAELVPLERARAHAHVRRCAPHPASRGPFALLAGQPERRHQHRHREPGQWLARSPNGESDRRPLRRGARCADRGPAAVRGLRDHARSCLRIRHRETFAPRSTHWTF